MIEGTPLVRATNIKSGHISDEGMIYIDPAEVPAGRNAVLSEGEIIVVRSGAYTGDSAIIPAKYSGAISGYDLVVTIREGYSPFFAWQFLCPAVRDLQFIPSSLRAAQPHLNAEELGETIVAVPPLPEQCAIAAFLDRETTRLDALIAKHERLIERLQEKRTALISHAVTKGLDPSAPMKDSGVPWLGQIPAHWEIKLLGTVARLQRGHDLTVQERQPGEVPVISSSGMSGFHDVAVAKGPGVVTGRYGTIGEIYYIEQDYWPMNTTLYVCDFKGNYPRYIYYLLMILPFDAYSGKSAVPGVDRKDLHMLSVVQPPESEQIAVAAFLDHETAKLDALIGKVRESIEKLREYRAALISAAVTGKIDVRGSL
jgi:type I restriction enzyme S subunit